VGSNTTEDAEFLRAVKSVAGLPSVGNKTVGPTSFDFTES
jgi:hypothetical protein